MTRVYRRAAGGRTARVLVRSAFMLMVFAASLSVVHGEGKLYLANYYAGINRANLDGSQVENLALSGFNWRSVAYDPVDEKIYWAAEGSSNVFTYQRANLDGSGVEDLLVTDQYRVSDMTIDSVARRIYWSDRGDYGVGVGIYCANLDFTNATLLLLQDEPVEVALDRVNEKVYWADYGGSIRRADLDGSDEEVVVSGLTQPRGVDVDPTHGKVYWTEADSIGRANLDGSGQEVLVDVGLDFPRGIALDVVGGKMYWADESPWFSRANLDGSGAEALSQNNVSYAGDIIVVPEPTMLGVMALGALALVRRRRN